MIVMIYEIAPQAAWRGCVRARPGPPTPPPGHSITLSDVYINNIYIYNISVLFDFVSICQRPTNTPTQAGWIVRPLNVVGLVEIVEVEPKALVWVLVGPSAGILGRSRIKICEIYILVCSQIF